MTNTLSVGLARNVPFGPSPLERTFLSLQEEEIRPVSSHCEALMILIAVSSSESPEGRESYK